MGGARKGRLRGSLGSSWGDAAYSSDEGASVHTASSLSVADSESEYVHNGDKEYAREHQDRATPLPPRVTRAGSREPQQQTPSKSPANRFVSPRVSRTPRGSPQSLQSTPASGSREPSFIMPTMGGSIDGFYNGSPLRGSQIRPRKTQQTSLRSQPGSTHSSPRIKDRGMSTAQSGTQAYQDKGQEELGPWHYVELFLHHVFWPVVQYILEVIAYTMHHFMKPLLGTALAIFLLITVLRYSSGVLTKTVTVALTPLCILPGSSYILPFCAAVPNGDHLKPLDFQDVAKVQSTFEDVLEASKDSYVLPATMKNSEIVIRDLRTLVKHSSLPSRTELEVEFTDFIETAGEASNDLSKYNARIGFTMDQVISTNSWTLRTLEGIDDRRASYGALSRGLAYINPFSVATSSWELEQQIFEQYVNHVNKVGADIKRLIDQGVALLQILNALENRLDAIADLAVRDDVIVGKNHDELLRQLWTKLGGNRSSKKANEQSLHLLTEVMRYKNIAVSHVSATLIKLQEISGGLENLRDGVAAPELLGYRSEIPLRLHLEVIEKSVERLKAVRGENQRIEKEALRRQLSGDSDVRELPAPTQTPTISLS